MSDHYAWLAESECDTLCHIEDDLRIGAFEMMEFEELCEFEYQSLEDVPPMPPDIAALYFSEPGTMDEAPRAADIWQDIEEE